MKVTITIDVEYPDRPTGRDGNTMKLLALCRFFPCVLFFEGRWLKANRFEPAIHIPNVPFENHGMFHMWHTLLTDEGVIKSIRDCSEQIILASGRKPTMFRPPFSRTDARIQKIIAAEGLREAGWTVDARDWEEANAEKLLSRIEAGCAAESSVVLLHSWPDVTLKVLPELIKRLTAAGAEFSTDL